MSQTPEPQTPALKKHDLISTKTGNVIHRVLKVNEDGSIKAKLSSSPDRDAFTIRAHEVGEWIRRG